MRRLLIACHVLVLVFVMVAITPGFAQDANSQAVKAEAAKPGAAAADGAATSDDGWGKKPKARNILFIILDDVGIDEMTVFGWGGGNATLPQLVAPKLPNIDTIALSGSDVWEHVDDAGVFADAGGVFHGALSAAHGGNERAD